MIMVKYQQKLCSPKWDKKSPCGAAKPEPKLTENDDVTTANFFDSIETKPMSTSPLFVKLRLQTVCEELSSSDLN